MKCEWPKKSRPLCILNIRTLRANILKNSWRFSVRKERDNAPCVHSIENADNFFNWKGQRGKLAGAGGRKLFEWIVRVWSGKNRLEAFSYKNKCKFSVDAWKMNNENHSRWMDESLKDSLYLGESLAKLNSTVMKRRENLYILFGNGVLELIKSWTISIVKKWEN